MTLNDICILIEDSFHATAKDEGTGIPLIRTSNIGKGRLKMDGVYRVSESKYRRRTRHAEPQRGDIILSRETPIGNVAIIRDEGKLCLGQRTVLIRPNPKKVVPEFLMYYLLAPQQQQKLLRTAKGTAAVHVNLSAICEMSVNHLPSLKEQQRIAAALAAYDELIDNMRKQSLLLKEVLQRLYTEWFIHLRFPDHEHTKISKDLPIGWKRLKIEDVCKIIVTNGNLTTEKKEYYRNGTIKLVTMRDVTHILALALVDTRLKITEAGLKNSPMTLLPPETILVSNRWDTGRLAVCKESVCANQNFFACIPKIKDSQMYLLCNLLNRAELIRKNTSGFSVQSITKMNFSKLDIILPADSVLEQFQQRSHVFLEQMMLCQEHSDLLQNERDLMIADLMPF